MPNSGSMGAMEGREREHFWRVAAAIVFSGLEVVFVATDRKLDLPNILMGATAILSVIAAATPPGFLRHRAADSVTVEERTPVHAGR
jgi:hypothetical protein